VRFDVESVFNVNATAGGDCGVFREFSFEGGKEKTETTKGTKYHEGITSHGSPRATSYLSVKDLSAHHFESWSAKIGFGML
jgi:hypothetical protein